jgi:hypothetical protein
MVTGWSIGDVNHNGIKRFFRRIRDGFRKSAERKGIVPFER